MMSREAGRIRDRAQHFLEWILELRARSARRSDRVERILLAGAAVVFLVATYIAWQRLPEVQRTLDASWLALAGLLALVGFVANGFEFLMTGRLMRRHIRAYDALRVSVVGTAANVLPIPGAVVVRTQALRQMGEGGSGALIVTTAVGVFWVASAGVLAAAFLLFPTADGYMAAVILLCSCIGVMVAAALVHFAGGRPGRLEIAVLAMIEVVSVFASGVRLYAVAHAIGFDVGLVEAITINLGVILSHAVGVVPAGLGLRELASGAFAESAGVPASVGVMLSVLDRVVIYVVLSVLVTLLMLIDRRRLFGTETGVDSR